MHGVVGVKDAIAKLAMPDGDEEAGGGSPEFLRKIESLVRRRSQPPELVGARLGVTPTSYTVLAMPSKHPRIAVTADPELGEALARVRAATGTREADATLLRRLAVEGAEAELEAGRNRRVAAEALFEAMDAEQFDLDVAAVDRLNAPPAT